MLQYNYFIWRETIKKRLFGILLITSLLSSCGNGNTSSTSTTSTHPIVSINLSNNKQIKCELYEDIAPITVQNFLQLVDNHFYDNTIFHRVIQNFMVQGGGFYIEDKTIYQKEATTIKGEFSANGIENNISHTKGVLSMARATAYDSGSSQFFICVADSTYLDGNYAAFGKTIDEESLNAAIEMSLAQTMTVSAYMRNFPVEPISITSISRIN